jgi:opacity protein-like surface antigen
MHSIPSRVLLCAIVAVLLAPAFVHAQTLGIGGRISQVRADVDSDSGSERFTGGQLRLGVSKRMSIELALDTKTVTNEEGTERVRQYPFQASLLLFPVRAGLSPFLLGGVGWYSTRVQQLDGDEVLDSVTTRKRGYHAGFGAEIRMGSHAGLHGDYRYTFLDFGSDEDDESSGGIVGALSPGSAVSRLLPSHDGSMWTLGLTIYF